MRAVMFDIYLLFKILCKTSRALKIDKFEIPENWFIKKFQTEYGLLEGFFDRFLEISYGMFIRVSYV